jgi:hypothetical protein
MNRSKLISCLFILTLTTTHLHAQPSKADLIIFSYNRPLQLYSLIESIYQYMTGLESISVIYRASDDRYARGYQVVQEQFAGVQYLRQGDNPRADFKPLTLQAMNQATTPYIIFAVDDMLVKDMVDLTECSDLMDQTGAYGFYLRLGLHTNYCYPLSADQAIPQHQKVYGDVYAWRFAGTQGDWNYPHTVDMTLLRKADVMVYFNHMHFSAPNELEGYWASMAGGIMNRFGLFYETSKAINLPLNRVQNDAHNRFMNFMTSDELLQKFEEGYKIDSKPLFSMKNRSAHMDYEPTFIKR